MLPDGPNDEKAPPGSYTNPSAPAIWPVSQPVALIATTPTTAEMVMTVPLGIRSNPMSPPFEFLSDPTMTSSELMAAADMV